MTLDESIKQLEQKVHQRAEFLEKVADFVLESTRRFGDNVYAENSSIYLIRRLETSNTFRFDVVEKPHITITIWHHDSEKQQDRAWEIVMKVCAPDRFQVETYALDTVLEEELLRMVENKDCFFEDLRTRAQIQQEQATELRRKQKRYGELLVEADRLKIEVPR